MTRENPCVERGTDAEPVLRSPSVDELGQPGGVAHVVVVDCAAEDRATIVAALTAAGLGASGFVDATSARRALKYASVAVVRGRDASEPSATLRAVRALAPGLPVVAVVGCGDAEVVRAFGEGADDVQRAQTSPDVVELTARVRQQVRRKGSLDELARRTSDAELLGELTQALASSLDPREILHTVVARTADVVHVDRVSIVLVRPRGGGAASAEGVADDRAFVVVTSDDRELRDLPIDLGNYPEIRHVLAERQPLVVADASTHPLLATLRGSSERPSGIPFASLAIVPLLFEERPMGVLFLRARNPTSFDDRALSLCKTLANATAVALRNARILQSLRDQTQQITFARYEAERRMRSMQRYADFFESIDDGVVVMDDEGYLLFANPRAKELVGFTESDLADQKLSSLVVEADRDKVVRIKAGLSHKEYPRAVDLRIRRKDGEVRIFSLTYSSVLHEDGAVLLTLRDVTAEREGVHELAQTKEFLEQLIDSSVDAIVSADMRGRIILFNRAAERVHGLPSREMIGTSVERLYPPGHARKLMALIRSDAHGGRGRLEGYRTEFLTAAGEVVPISLSAALITRGDRPIGTVGIFTDLRERLRMEQRLENAQEQLRAQEKQTIVAELAGAAAHELNQPLTSVMGYAELLRRRLEPGTPQHHAAEIIVSEAERMAEIVRKIGKITRYETKSYVGTARILDLDRASREEGSGPSSAPESSKVRAR
ncbi:MAG: PAS domain S-box protein [Deltaproteobacteria bacterium]|nr:PAS domain S-box protein [Deltaproteobacteria bacterium]